MSARSSRPIAAIRSLLVVIPARDEQDHIEACLEAVDHAVRRVHAHPAGQGRRQTWPVPSVRVVVVADTCADTTDAIAGGRPGVLVVPTRAGRVGAARAIGVRRGMSDEAAPPDHIWIANTDADSRVPPDWLTHQLDLAHAGADLVCGLVEPDAGDCGESTYRAWAAAYQRVDGHSHIHGANLGIRASSYLAAGGFDPAARAHEDVAVVRAARRLGFAVVATSGATVATSGRTEGRVGSQGFSGYLRRRQEPGGSTVVA